MTGMNDNAKLYVQSLYYKENGAPYACLAQPWWVRLSKEVYYPRHRCELEPLICGKNVFERISKDLLSARHSVDIITWGFDPGMVLVRGATAELGQRYGDLLKEIATRKDSPVKVRLLVWHDDPLSQRQMKNNPGYYGLRFPDIGATRAGYYSAVHQNYNAEWFEQVCAGNLPNISFRVRSVSAELAEVSLKDEKCPSGPHAEIAKIYATHHQKMMLIDYEEPAAAVGYVMGHNSITDFWDTEAHVFRDPQRERIYKENPLTEHNRAWSHGPALDPAGGLSIPGLSPPAHILEQKRRAAQDYLDRNSTILKPYQDVSCRLRGAILYDLNHNFCQAWRQAKRPSSLFLDVCWLLPPFRAKYIRLLRKLTDKLVFHTNDAELLERRKSIRLSALNLKNGQHSVQLLRTQPEHQEKTVKECYANLTRQMNHYIFIQNQYIQYEAWAEHLKDCVQRLRSAGYRKKVYVFIQTSTPESDGMDLPTYDVVKSLGKSESMPIEHAETVEKARIGKARPSLTSEELEEQGICVAMGSLWTCIRGQDRSLRADDYEEIYIHSKVAVVDDAAFTLGSANLNLRSMVLDSELNILSQAADVAFKLRADLFKQSTGRQGANKFGDMASTYQDWIEFMDDNKTAKAAGKVLECQLCAFQVTRKPGAPVM